MSGPGRGRTGRRGPARREPAGPADHVLLDATAGAALRWLDGMRPCFRLPADVTTDADPDTTLKPLGELAELAHLISTLHPLPHLRAQAGELLLFAWQEARDGELFAELVRGEPQATYPVELYGVFARAGLRHPGAEELMAVTTALRRWRVAREDHTRTLGVLGAERRIGLGQHADFGSVLARTGLGQQPEPWALDRRAVYGVTHDVFHLTDWGRARHRLPPALAGYLRLWVPAWLGCWLEEQSWDLAGELLAVAACLPQAPYHAAAWELLAAAQGPDGAVPESGAVYGDGAVPESSAQAFTACYHSTLVTAFAATLARVGAPPYRGAPAHPPVAAGAPLPIRESEARL